MGLLTREQALQSVEGDFTSGIEPDVSVNSLKTEFDETSFSDGTKARFRNYNWIGSRLVDETNGVDNTPDPDFDFYGSLKGTEYEQDAEYFVDALNDRYLDALKLRYAREQKDRALIDNSSWFQAPISFLAYMLGPENLIPGTLAVKGTRAGYSAFKSGRNVAGANIGATAVAESQLHASQGLITGEESALALGVSGIFGFGIGSGLATLANRGIKSNWAQVFDQAFKQSDDFKIKYDKASPEDRVLLLQEAKTLAKEYRLAEVQEMSKLSDELKARLTDDALDNQLDELYLDAQRIRRQHSLSAASDVPTLDDLSLFGKAAGAYAKGTKWFNPILRSLHSPSPHARRVAANLFENPMLMKMNDFRDSPAALETRIKNWTEGRLADVISRTGTSGGKGVYTDMRKAGIHMSRDEFRKQVARAMRRNDGNVMTADGVDTGQPSGQFNEFVVKAAKIARKDLFEHARQELNKVGFEIEGKKSATADSYLTRMWNPKKLNAGEQKFKARDGHVWNYIKNAIDHEIANATHKFEKRIDNLAREIDELKREKLRRQSQLEEMPQKTLKGEYKRLLELDERIGQLETELRARPDITQELGEALGEVARRILPDQTKVDLVNEIEVNPNNPRIHYQKGDEAIAKAELEDLARLLKENAPDEVIDNHPAIQRAIRQSKEIPETVKEGQPLPPDWHKTREFNFDGERVKGLKSAYDRLYYKSERLAWTDEGLTPPESPVKHERKAVILLGPPASGKSSLANPIARDLRAMIIDPDEVKKALPEYQDGIGAHAVHEESSHISKEIRDDALEQGANLLLPKVGDKAGSIQALTRLLKENGYDVEITLMQVDYKEVRNRMYGRFLETGRFVPPSYLKSVGNKPSETFEVLKKKGVANGYSKVDNNAPKDQDPEILEDSRQFLEGRLFRLQRRGRGGREETRRVDQDPGWKGVRSLETGPPPKGSKQRINEGTAEGAFFDSDNLIQIVRSALDPEATLRHEAVHALRSLKLFKDEEWALLEQSAKEFDWVGKHKIASRYDGVFDGDDAARQQGMLEEAIAEEFSKWRAGELEVTPEVKTIFERIQDALKRIAEVLRANGIESYEDVFKLVDEGEIAGRAKAQKQNELARLENEYAAVKGNIEKLEQGSLVPPEITPGELQQMIDLVGNGKRPNKPESLFQFLQKQGGMLDEDKALLNLGMSPKTHPELVRSASDAINETTYSVADKINKGQPLSMEDAGFLAWNEGFFPDRPSTKTFLKALREELQGEENVRFKDLKQQRKHQDFVTVEEELNRLGINPQDPIVRFARTPFEEDIVSATARVLDDKADEQIAKLEKKIAETKIEHDQDMFPLELDLNGHVDEVVNGLFKKLTGRGNVEDFVNDNIIDYGFLKGRTFGIRDELIEEFLEDDIEHIMRRYTRNVAGQIEMKKRFGNLHLKNHLEEISDEFNGLRQEVHYSDKSPKQKQKEINKLEKQEAAAIRDLQFARDKVLGRYEQDLDSSGWARTVDAALSWQYMTSLGGVLVTSLSDAWRTPMVQGFGHVFGKQLPALIAGNKGVKINRALARKYAGIAEIINNSRLAHMAGLNDPFSVSTPAEIAIQKMTDRFSKLTGLPYWNQFWKEFAGAVIIDRALGDMVKGLDNLSAKEVRWLRSLGLGDMATGAKQLQAEGAIEKVQGLWTINPDKMPDALMDVFFAGVKKEIDTTIVSKGIGDAPLFAETKLGRIATQFKSFGAASNQRMLIRGMQDDLGNFTTGMAGMITTGMFIYMLKQLEAGREIDDNPGTWLAEGIDRSGMFFLFFEANNIVEKIGGPGVYQALDAKAPASRFASRNAVGALAGPLFGSATDLFTILGQGARAINPGAEVDLSPGDIKATRRLAPYATLPPWRWLVDGYIVPTMQEEVR